MLLDRLSGLLIVPSSLDLPHPEQRLPDLDGRYRRCAHHPPGPRYR